LLISKAKELKKVHKNIFGFSVVLELKVKNWTLYQEYNYIKNQNMAITKVALHSSMKKKLRRIQLIFDIEK